MKNKRRKSSPVWLIIILGAIIFLINAIIASVRHQQQLGAVYQELEKMSQQAEELQLQKEEAIKQLEQTLQSQTTSASASPKINSVLIESTFSAQTSVSTFSGENF